jgi:hypothetical protein
MGLIDKASLLFVPSVVEEGKAFNVLPSGNRAPDNKGGAGYDQTRADFDFDRGSNTAATRIGSDGLLKKYRENVLTESNNFSDSDWTLDSGMTLTSGQSGYDGSNDAWLLERNVAFDYLRQDSTNSGVQTYSVYAKAGTFDWVFLRFQDTGGYNGYYFDLSNGVKGSADGTTIDSNITSVGGGWYRCDVTINATLQKVWIYPVPNDNGVGVTGVGNIYIQNAQLESGLVSTDYLNSTSVTGKAGVLVDLPRINYDANGENGSLLLEPSRQQLIQFSEYFGGYTTTETNVTTNTGTSPEGVQNASSLIETTASSSRRILPSSPFTGTGGANYTLSVYVKKIAGQTTRHIYWMCQLGADAIYAHFDMDDFSVHEQNDNGTGSVTNADIIPVGNDWYRLILSGSISTTGGDYYNQLYFEDTPRTGFGAQSYTGNGTSGFEIYGWQAEAGSYVSSYIPNHSGTGGVTRAADSCSVTGASDVIGQSEGTLFVEAETLENGADCRITLSDNTIYNRVSIEWDANADTIKGFIGVGGNVESTNHNQTNRNKIAIVYNSSDARFFINGTKVMTDTSVPSLSGMDRIEFSNFSGPLPFVGKVYKMYVSKEKLTDAECETLTTL